MRTCFDAYLEKIKNEKKTSNILYSESLEKIRNTMTNHKKRLK
jgi:hypothetical protein